METARAPHVLCLTSPDQRPLDRGGQGAGLDSGHPHGEGLTAISDGLAHLHMQYYGKGPTKAKAHFVDDLVVFMLEPEE